MATKKKVKAIKKKAIKKVVKAKPLTVGEVVNLPCGGRITVAQLFSNVLTIDLTAVLLSGTNREGDDVELRNVKILVNDDVLKILPGLAKRALASFKTK